jgi:hypothetical protein
METKDIQTDLPNLLYCGLISDLKQTGVPLNGGDVYLQKALEFRTGWCHVGSTS